LNTRLRGQSHRRAWRASKKPEQQPTVGPFLKGDI
jgi:hypothetical protein